MLKYSGELYAKFGRKYVPTGKTGADWDAMAAKLYPATVGSTISPQGLNTMALVWERRALELEEENKQLRDAARSIK